MAREYKVAHPVNMKERTKTISGSLDVLRELTRIEDEKLFRDSVFELGMAYEKSHGGYQKSREFMKGYVGLAITHALSKKRETKGLAHLTFSLNPEEVVRSIHEVNRTGEITNFPWKIVPSYS